MAFRLPERMEEIWFSIAKGERETDVATRLNITRQAVSKAIRVAYGKIASMFLELAEILNLDVARINVEKGYMIARSRQLGLRVYAFYVPSKGIRILFGIKPYCGNESLLQTCRLIIDWGRELKIIDRVEGEIEFLIDKIIRKIEG